MSEQTRMDAIGNAIGEVAVDGSCGVAVAARLTLLVDGWLRAASAAARAEGDAAGRLAERKRIVGLVREHVTELGEMWRLIRAIKKETKCDNVADCGCIYTGEGRSWCPTCLDGGGVTHMDKQAAALREAVEIIGWLRDHERTWTDEVWQRISAFLEKWGTKNE